MPKLKLSKAHLRIGILSLIDTLTLAAKSFGYMQYILVGESAKKEEECAACKIGLSGEEVLLWSNETLRSGKPDWVRKLERHIKQLKAGRTFFITLQ